MGNWVLQLAPTFPTPMNTQIEVGLGYVAWIFVCIASFALEKHPSCEFRTDRHLRIDSTQVRSPSSRSRNRSPCPAKDPRHGKNLRLSPSFLGRDTSGEAVGCQESSDGV